MSASAWILVAAVAALAGSRLRARVLRQATRAQLAGFTHDPALGTFAEARPRFRVPGVRREHAILLVHGYSASTASFETLIADLDAAGLAYYAPALTGFGLDDLSLVEVARVDDWRRDVRQAYELLREVADEVSVVGVSFGARLAADLAGEVPIRHLVLVSPYFLPGRGSERLVRTLLRSPGVGPLLATVMPYYRKPRRTGRVSNVDLLDAEAARRAFHYQALPLRSLVQMACFDERGTPAGFRTASLTVLYGGHDETSDVPAYLARLTDLGVAHSARCFEASDHGVLEDRERAAACRYIVEALVSPACPRP